MTDYKIAKGKKILLLDGFLKQSLPYMRSFKKHGCEITLLCRSKIDCGYLSKFPDHRIMWDYDYNNTSSTDKLINLIKNGGYDFVYPMFDMSVRFISHHKEELSKYAIIIANDKEIFDNAFNKENVMKVCMENKIPCPKTYLEIDCLEDLLNKEISFPIIIKPHSMYGARGFHVFKSMEELFEYVENKKINLSEYVIQELIGKDSKVMGANIYIDRNGEIKSSYLYVCEHIYPEVGGTSTLNAFLNRKDILEYCEKLVKIMKLRGEVGIDLMLDNRDNIGKVIEINVRPVHGIAMGFKFGIDNGLQALQDALGYQVSNMSLNRTDTAVRITQTDVLWFIKSPNRFKNSPRKLGYKHVVDQMFYIDDPLPWFGVLLDGIINYKKKMAEKTQ